MHPSFRQATATVHGNPAPLAATRLNSGGILAIWLAAAIGAFDLCLFGAPLAAIALLLLSGLALQELWPVRTRLRPRWMWLAIAAAALVIVCVGSRQLENSVLDLLIEALLLLLGGALGQFSRRCFESDQEQHFEAISAQLRQEDQAGSAFSRTQDYAATIDDVHWEIDRRLRLRFLSPGFEQHFGVPVDDVLGLDPLDIAERFLGRYGRLAVCARQMRCRQPIRTTRLAWRDQKRRRRVAVIRAVPKFCSAGNFIGYRGVLFEQLPQCS